MRCSTVACPTGTSSSSIRPARSRSSPRPRSRRAAAYDAALQGADDALRGRRRSTWSCLAARAGGAQPFRELAAAAAFLALVPIALGPVSLNTYDAWPALLDGRRARGCSPYGRGTLALGLLGAAFAAKLYAVVLVPLALLRLGRGSGLRAGWRRSPASRRCWSSPGSRSRRTASGRASARSSAGGCTPRAWARACCSPATGSGSTTRTSSSACTRRRLAGPRGRSPRRALAATRHRCCGRCCAVAAVWSSTTAAGTGSSLAFAAAIAGVLAFAKVLSPQYLVWLIPFVPFGGVAAGALLVAALALAQSWYFHYRELWAIGGRSGRCSPGTSCSCRALPVPLVEDEHAVAREDELPVRAPAQPDERRRGRKRRRAVGVARAASRRRRPTSRRRASAG